MSSDYSGPAVGDIADGHGRHFPNGKFTDLAGGRGGQPRWQCGGCGDPLDSSYDKWLSAFSGQQACRGYWREDATDTPAPAAQARTEESCS